MSGRGLLLLALGLLGGCLRSECLSRPDADGCEPVRALTPRLAQSGDDLRLLLPVSADGATIALSDVVGGALRLASTALVVNGKQVSAPGLRADQLAALAPGPLTATVDLPPFQSRASLTLWEGPPTLNEDRPCASLGSLAWLGLAAGDLYGLSPQAGLRRCDGTNLRGTPKNQIGLYSLTCTALDRTVVCASQKAAPEVVRCGGDACEGLDLPGLTVGNPAFSLAGGGDTLAVYGAATSPQLYALSAAGAQPLVLDGGVLEVMRLAIGDLNRDGAADLVAISSTGEVAIYLREGTRLVREPARSQSARDALAGVPLNAKDTVGPFIGDIDHDGYADLVFQSGADLRWVAGLSDGGFYDYARQIVSGAFANVRPLALGDVDGDCRSDVVGLSTEADKNVPVVLRGRRPDGRPGTCSTAGAAADLGP